MINLTKKGLVRKEPRSVILIYKLFWTIHTNIHMFKILSCANTYYATLFDYNFYIENRKKEAEDDPISII